MLTDFFISFFLRIWSSEIFSTGTWRSLSVIFSYLVLLVRFLISAWFLLFYGSIFFKFRIFLSLVITFREDVFPFFLLCTSECFQLWGIFFHSFWGNFSSFIYFVFSFSCISLVDYFSYIFSWSFLYSIFFKINLIFFIYILHIKNLINWNCIFYFL